MDSKTEKILSREERLIRLFKRLTAIPYLLVLFALLMPLANISCSEKTIAEPNLYKLASGLDLEKDFQEPALGVIKKMQEGNSTIVERFKSTIPNFPKTEPIWQVYAILAGAVLAAIFACITPLGSLTMGMLTMVSMWFLLSQIGRLCASTGVSLIKVEPGAGIYAASAMIIIGTAMNLASLIRPIIAELKARKQKKKAL